MYYFLKFSSIKLLTIIAIFKIVIAIWAIIPAVLLHGNHLTIFRIDVLHNTRITGWKRKIIIDIVYTENFSPLDGHAKQKGSQIPFYHLQGHRTQVNKVGCVSFTYNDFNNIHSKNHRLSEYIFALSISCLIPESFSSQKSHLSRFGPFWQ